MSTKEETQTPLPEMGDMTLEESPRVVSTWANPNLQLSSPFFSGRIPAEIRNLIFELALTETTIPSPEHDIIDIHPNHDPDHPSDVATLMQGPLGFGSFIWPGHLGPNIIHTALVRTCRLIYLETAHLPSRHKQIVYYGSAADWFPQSGPLGEWQPLKSSPVPRTAPMLPLHAVTTLRRAHLFLSLSYLESQFEPFVRRSYHRIHSTLAPTTPTVRIFSSLVHIRLTLCRRFWHGWIDPIILYGRPVRAPGRAPESQPGRALESHPGRAPLEINPFTNNLSTTIFRSSDPDGARGAMAAAMENDSPVAEPGSWASAFAMMPALQSLTIDFEADADRIAEMERIVAWARRAWRFAVLRNAPLPVYVDPKTGEEGAWYMSGVERAAGGKWLAKHEVLGREMVGEGVPTADGRPVRRAWLVAEEDSAVERWKWRSSPGKRDGICFCHDERGPGMERTGRKKEGWEDCKRRKRSMQGLQTARCFVWTVTWTAREEGEGEGEVARQEEKGPVLPAMTKEEEESRYNYALLF